ncbi:UNVERIFIED_CONTAM: hypothetical protein FKN15_051274 [Acipenser sinensis]
MGLKYMIPNPWHSLLPNVEEDEFNETLCKKFPGLEDAGGFELLKIKGPTASRQLAQIPYPNEGYSANYLSSPDAEVRYAMIYVKPLQRDISTFAETIALYGPLTDSLLCPSLSYFKTTTVLQALACASSNWTVSSPQERSSLADVDVETGKCRTGSLWWSDPATQRNSLDDASFEGEFEIKSILRSHCSSTTLDVCPTCLKGEEWCFAVGEVGHIAPDQPPPWQEKEEPERPLREDLHPPKRTNALSSEGVWDWLVEPGRDYEEALPAVINLLWARDGERWEAWEQQHHPASLPDIAAMVLNYLAADMGETLLLPSPAPKREEPERPTPEWEEPERPTPEWEEPERPTPEWEEPERPTPEWEEPERPTPEWEEPERPTPEWEEPERPTPEWEEPERPTPEWEEPERPTPEWEEPERPTPEWEEPEPKYTSDTSAVDESFHFLADNICTPSQERAVVAELEASVDPNIAPQKKKACRPGAVGAPPTLPSSSKFCKTPASPGDAGVERKLITDRSKKTPTHPKEIIHGPIETPTTHFNSCRVTSHAPQKKRGRAPRYSCASPVLPGSSKIYKTPERILIIDDLCPKNVSVATQTDSPPLLVSDNLNRLSLILQLLEAPQKKKACRPGAVGAPPTLPSSSKFCKTPASHGDAGVERKLITDRSKKTPTHPKEIIHGPIETPTTHFNSCRVTSHAPQKKRGRAPRYSCASPVLPGSSKIYKTPERILIIDDLCPKNVSVATQTDSPPLLVSDNLNRLSLILQLLEAKLSAACTVDNERPGTSKLSDPSTVDNERPGTSGMSRPATLPNQGGGLIRDADTDSSQESFSSNDSASMNSSEESSAENTENGAPPQDGQSTAQDKVSQIEDYVMRSVPHRSKRNAEFILQAMIQNSSTTSWNDQGEFILRGNVVRGTHMVDLIKTATGVSNVTDRRAPTGWDEFLEGLACINIPNSVIPNTQTRSRVQAFKITPLKISRRRKKRKNDWEDY